VSEVAHVKVAYAVFLAASVHAHTLLDVRVLSAAHYHYILPTTTTECVWIGTSMVVLTA
jgi:hypothetical protein